MDSSKERDTMSTENASIYKEIRLRLEGKRLYNFTDYNVSPSDLELWEKRKVVEEMTTYLQTTPIDEMNWTITESDFMNTQNAPGDATAMEVEAIVRAAIEWRLSHEDKLMTREDWDLMEACIAYGDTYKGLKSS